MRGRALLPMALLAGLLAGSNAADVAGRVIDANTGEPIARVRLTVRFFQGAVPEVYLLSDADGTFHLTNAPDGPYQITAEKAGYLGSSQGRAARAGGAADSNPVVMKMAAQAAVGGSIVDDHDLPMPNAFLELWREQVVNGRRQLGSSNGSAADESGDFRLFGLSSGRYYLSIRQAMAGSRAKSVAYPTLFYPGVTDAAAAQPIDLKAGDDVELHIKLPAPLPAHEIRGVLTSQASSAGFTLMRLPFTPYSMQAAESQWDRKTGIFRLSRVPPGVYRLTSNVWDGKANMIMTAMITVGNEDVEGVRLAPVEASVEGILRMDGSAPPQQRLYVNLQAPVANAGAQVDADGKFHATNMTPGTYRVTPSVAGSQCVRSVQLGGRDVRDNLPVEGPTGPVEIVLTSHCGVIEGTLNLGDFKPAGNLTAMLLRKSGDEVVLEKQTGISPFSVNFRIQNITPGDYTLYVWPQEAEIEYANAEYMRPFEAYGKAVTVTEDNKVSVTIDKVLVPVKN